MKYLISSLTIYLLLFVSACSHDEQTCCQEPKIQAFEFVLQETNYPDFNNRLCDPELHSGMFTIDTIVTSPNINDLCFVHGNATLVCYVKRHNMDDSLFILDRNTGTTRFVMHQRSIYNLNAAQNTLVCEANGGEVWVVELSTGNTRLMPKVKWQPKLSPTGKLIFSWTNESGEYFPLVINTSGEILRAYKSGPAMLLWNAKGDGIYSYTTDTNNSKVITLIMPLEDKRLNLDLPFNFDGSFVAFAHNFEKTCLYSYKNSFFLTNILDNTQFKLVQGCATQTPHIISYDPFTQRVFFCLQHHHVNDDKTIDFIEQHWYSVDEAGTDFKEVKLNL